MCHCFDFEEYLTHLIELIGVDSIEAAEEKIMNIQGIIESRDARTKELHNKKK